VLRVSRISGHPYPVADTEHARVKPNNPIQWKGKNALVAFFKATLATYRSTKVHKVNRREVTTYIVRNSTLAEYELSIGCGLC